MQWMADVTEHAHITEIKQPARSGNNQDYYTQIARHLDHSDKCFRFNVATQFASMEQGRPEEESDNQEDEHEPESETLHAIHYYLPACVSVNYFKVACHDRDHTYPYLPYPDLSMPIPSHQNHFQAPNAKPKPSGSIPSQLASNASPNPLTPSRLSNALPNTLTPLRLVNAFPTQCTFDLSSSSCQVDSRPNAPSTFPLPRVKSIPDIHTHSRPNAI